MRFGVPRRSLDLRTQYNGLMTQAQWRPPILIQEAEELGRLVTTLASQRRLAVDTESNSLHAYRERVCLIQVSTSEADYIIDPLSLTDVSPLAPILADPEIEHVFHGADYDLVSLQRDFSFKVGRLFDTQIACRALGRRKSGLAGLLAEEFGIRQNKRFQRANWGKRPLSPEMLDYARLDTRYLLPLRDRLAVELEAAGALEATRELFAWQAMVEAADIRFDPEGFWRIGHAARLNSSQISVLRELYLFRDSQARRLDRPPFKVITDQTLLTVAEARPRSIQALSRVEGVTRTQIRRFGRGILKAIRLGLRAPPPRRPPRKRSEEAVVERYEKLRQWRKGAAKRRRVESDVILPREILWKIAKGYPANKRQLRALMRPLEWRFRTYGDEILRMLEE